MTNLLIIGASGAIARHVIEFLHGNESLKTTLYLRNASRLSDLDTTGMRIVEGEKERVQVFQGNVIRIHRGTSNATFTVRKISDGVGVERIFPLHSPYIEKVELLTEGRVRRSRLYYLRKLKGKAARIKPKNNW